MKTMEFIDRPEKEYLTSYSSLCLVFVAGGLTQRFYHVQYLNLLMERFAKKFIY